MLHFPLNRRDSCFSTTIVIVKEVGFSLGWDSSSVEWSDDEEEASAGEIVKMQWNWQIKWLLGSKHSVCDDLVLWW